MEFNSLQMTKKTKSKRKNKSRERNDGLREVKGRKPRIDGMDAA
jgi:hypothetical protein